MSKMEIPCQCAGMDVCVCPSMEKALRGWMNGVLGPMDDEQRAWCLSEIDSVEGHARADHLNDLDSQLARGVLDAWRDYCRDKGIL